MVKSLGNPFDASHHANAGMSNQHFKEDLIMFNDKSFRKAEASEPVWGSGTLRSHAVPLKVATSLTMITPFQLQSFSMSDATVQFRILHWTRWRSGMSFILSWKSRASILCLKILSSTTIHNTLVILEATVGVYRDMESWTSLHILVQVLLIPLTHTRVRACLTDCLSLNIAALGQRGWDKG